MKMKKIHRVPLSDRAIEIVQAAMRLGGKYVFMGKSKDHPISNMAMLMTMRRLKLSAVPHGFRSSFKDWCSETTNFPREVSELALAHGIEDKVEAAYRRGDLFGKRRALMDQWAKHCASPVKDNVVSLRSTA
jgi:integrase